MTTQREKIQKLRALARSPNQHEAALARAKVEELESRHVTAKTLAHAIARLLEGRGMVVRVKHRYAREVNRHQDLPSHKTKIDADIRYFKSQSRALTSRNRNRSHRVRVKFTRRPMVGAQGV